MTQKTKPPASAANTHPEYTARRTATLAKQEAELRALKKRHEIELEALEKRFGIVQSKPTSKGLH